MDIENDGSGVSHSLSYIHLTSTDTSIYIIDYIDEKRINQLKNKYLRRVVIILPIIVAVLCLVQMVENNNQAMMPVPKEYTFTGEYSYDGENWYPYNEDSDISALEGDMVVKGHLDSDVPEGGILNFYCNHIGVSIYVNGEALYIDTATEIKNYGIDLMPSMCGKYWGQLLCPEITAEDEIEIRFINYHNHGNKNAYKEALSSLLMTPPDNTILEVYLKSYIEPFERAGYALLIVAMMLLGASLSVLVFKSDMTKALFKLGITTLFAAGYIVFDVMMLHFSDGLLVVRTYGRQLCLMLAVYCIGWMVCDVLKDKRKKIAEILMYGSGIINLIIILLATIEKVLLFDTIFFWEIAQYVISIGLIVLCLLEIKRGKKAKKELLAYICVNIALAIDMTGAFESTYYSGMFFKVVYVLMLISFLINGTKQVVLDHQASIKNKKLKAELEQSRIAVMLSQIQPHFLYNSLTSVMDLCDRDPKQAKAAIADFADYLRGNLSALKTEDLISFRTELGHIQKYLRLEKLRFQEELEVLYDIQVQDFMLPALSVQPLIENAVKHGVGQKVGGGIVSVHTYETDEHYVIRIEDDGVGFEDGEYANENSTHVGIENTKRRLDMMMNARLEIESKKGEGTKATVLIPKRRD